MKITLLDLLIYIYSHVAELLKIVHESTAECIKLNQHIKLEYKNIFV